MILLVCVIICSVLLGFIHNGLIPFSIPISNIVCYKYWLYYHFILLLFITFWLISAIHETQITNRILPFTIAAIIFALLFIDVKSGAPHVVVAALAMTLMVFYALKTALRSNDILQWILGIIIFLSLSLILTKEDKIVAVVEAIMLIGIGSIVVLKENNTVIAAVNTDIFRVFIKQLEIPRLSLLGGLWLLVIMGGLAGTSLVKVNAFALPLYFTLITTGTIIAFSCYRSALINTLICGSFAIVPLLLLFMAGLSEINLTGVIFLTFICFSMWGSSVIYDNYFDDLC